MTGVQFGLSRPRAAALVAVAGLHAMLFWALALTPFKTVLPGPNSELTITVFETTPRLSIPQPIRLSSEFTNPETVIVPEPDIVVNDGAEPAVAATPMTQKIPPRPDGSQPHELPSLPEQYRAFASTASLMLRILILRDGSIGEADVAQSSGAQELDAFVCGFVRANWHYLPATVSGEPVEDWMTVVVRFAG